MSPKVMAGSSGTIQRPDNFKIFMTKMQKKNNKLVSKFAPPPQTKTTTRDINLGKNFEYFGNFFASGSLQFEIGSLFLPVFQLIPNFLTKEENVLLFYVLNLV